MNKCHTNIGWRNDTTPAINETNLNYMDGCIDTIDDRVVAMDTSKANQSDLLTALSGVTYNTATGVFTFTWKNGTTATFDLNIEKIPVSFSMDANGVITMITADGTTYTADVRSILVLYTFANSSRITWTVTQNGNNYTVSADIVDGSITAEKLQPNFLADCQAAKNAAEAAETAATDKATLAKSYAVGGTGTRAGEDTDNAKYYKEQAAAIVNMSFSGLSDTDFNNLQDGQVAVYHSSSQMWENEDMSAGLLPHVIVISDTGSTVTLTKGLTVITANETSTGHFEADVTEYGTWTIDSILSGDDAQTTLNIDAVKIYTITDWHFSASITVTYPSGGTCTLSATGQTTQAATGSPYTFTVHEAATYTLTATNRGASRTATITITTTGQTETYSFLVDGATVLTTDDVEIWLDCACLWDKAYTTEAEIIADSEALLALISDHNAVDYMARSTSFRTLICADALAMLYIGEYNYCADALLADNTWFSAIGESEYVGLVVEPIIPKMTSNTTPSGVASGSATYAGFEYYYAFDGIETDAQRWTSGAQGTQWIQYKCAAAKKVNAIRLNAFVYNGVSCAQNCKLLASNDGSTYVELTAFTTTGTAHIKALTFANSTAYQYYKVECSNDDTNWIGIVEIQLYNREDASAPSHTLKTFATANEEEILEMVCKADRGEIDLYDDAGWRVGQEHNTSISAIPASGSGYTVGEAQASQIATLVLSNHGGVELVNSVLDKQGQTRTQCSFEYDWKNCFPEKGYMNSTGTNSGSWDSCARRAWCNYGLRNAVSPYIRAASHQFKTITAETYNGSTNKTSNDYFALRAEKEVQGSREHSNATEANALSQATYYATSANKIKTLNNEAEHWWNRSPYYVNSTEFCFTGRGGGKNTNTANTAHGIAPFGAF